MVPRLLTAVRWSMLSPVTGFIPLSSYQRQSLHRNHPKRHGRMQSIGFIRPISKMVQGVAIEDGCIINRNPADGSLIAKVPISTPEDIENVITAAKNAQPAWAQVPLEERCAILTSSVEETLSSQIVSTSRLVVEEMGKILSEAMEEVEAAAEKEEFMELVKKANKPQHFGGNCVVVRDPHGVVAILAPWNFPVEEILFLAMPALAAGNAVVIKPSEVAPLSGEKAVEALQANTPPGLVGLIQGDGAAGAQLVSSPDVDMVAMTGSSATGKKILTSCAADLKRVVLELGGKDPMVVFADADIELAAKHAVDYSLMNCGQVCCAIERIYVAEEIRAPFEERVAEMAREYISGDGLEASSKIGPLVTKSQRDIVAKHVEGAITVGAKVLVGGPEAASILAAENPNGNFYPATVLTDVPQDAKISHEETFGPVISITPFDGQDATGIELANDTEYGLSACVYTNDVERGARVASAIRAGQVGINNWPLDNASLECPWVGQKGSGFGYHSGADGWRQFSSPKSIIFNDSDSASAIPDTNDEE